MADTLSKLAKPAGRDAPEDAPRARRRLGPRQDRRPRAEGPVRPHARLQAALRGRADAHPAPPAEARLPQPVPDDHRRGQRRRPRGLRGRRQRRREGARRSRAHQGRFDRIKILGDGELTKAVTVSAHAFSKAAAEKIQKAGGKVVLVGAEPRQPTRARSMSALSAFSNIGKVPELRRRDPFHGRAARRSTASASSSRSPASTGP